MKNKRKFKKIKIVQKILKIKLIKIPNILQTKLLKIKLKNKIKKNNNMYIFMDTIMYLKIKIKNKPQIKKRILSKIKIKWMLL